MSEERCRIGRAAAMAGVHPDTLRQWDREGLLVATRNDAGWRGYTPEQVERARRLAQERRRVPVR